MRRANFFYHLVDLVTSFEIISHLLLVATSDVFSRRFMKGNATIIVALFQSTRTDQKFSEFFWCQIELNHKGFFRVAYNSRRD